MHTYDYVCTCIHLVTFIHFCFHAHKKVWRRHFRAKNVAQGMGRGWGAPCVAPPPKKRRLPRGHKPTPPPPPPPCPWGGLNVDVLNYTHKYRTRNRVSDRGQGRGRQREGDQPWSWWVCCGGGYTIYILYKTEGDQKWSSWVYSL
jgi:hypothetical protein